MNEQKKKGQSRTWAKFGAKSAKVDQKTTTATAGKLETGRSRLPAPAPSGEAANGRSQKKKKINKNEIGI
jgi:hypothetical protein